MSLLLERQFLFARLLPRLLDKAHELGFEVTGGEWQRSPQQAKSNAEKGVGISGSLHILSLAVDLHLFLDGRYLDRSESYAELGEWWEKQNALCMWGGRFERRDGNHFSVQWEGRK